nr:MAG TPA: hypothetical protein [Caudoviricetes sp.]
MHQKDLFLPESVVKTEITGISVAHITHFCLERAGYSDYCTHRTTDDPALYLCRTLRSGGFYFY